MSRNFKTAYEKLIKYEGGYADDPTDRGGETYKGIARNFHGDWEGWKIIDEEKKKKNFPKRVSENKTLEKLVAEFYKKNYWDALNLDAYPAVIAEEIFESAVNCGIKRAVRFIQNTANILNNNQKYYPNVKVDGIFGKQTRKAFNECLLKHNERTIANVLNIFQGCYYVELMIKNEANEKYIGWFNRIEVKR